MKKNNDQKKGALGESLLDNPKVGFSGVPCEFFTVKSKSTRDQAPQAGDPDAAYQTLPDGNSRPDKKACVIS